MPTIIVKQPLFSARNSTAQPVTSSIPTKVTLSVEIADTNSNFASSRFTPTVAGYYQFNGVLRGGATNLTNNYVALYVNGAEFRRGGTINTSAITAAQMVTVSDIIYMNGSTDYIEMWGVVIGTTTVFEFVSAAICCEFSGHFIRS